MVQVYHTHVTRSPHVWDTTHTADTKTCMEILPNVQLTFVIHQQLTYKNMLNSVHNCESRSRMNYIPR